jgi:hypothetical protein
VQVINYGQLTQTATNTSGYTLKKGDVVVFDTGYENSTVGVHVTYSSTVGATMVAGVAYASARNNQPVALVQMGIGTVRVDNSTGAISVGDSLMLKGGSLSSASNRGVACKYVQSGVVRSVIGIALEAYNSATIGEISVRVICVSAEAATPNYLNSTDDLPEGATNLYYTEERVASVLTSGPDIADASFFGSLIFNDDPELGGVITESFTINSDGISGKDSAELLFCDGEASLTWIAGSHFEFNQGITVSPPDNTTASDSGYSSILKAGKGGNALASTAGGGGSLTFTAGDGGNSEDPELGSGSGGDIFLDAGSPGSVAGGALGSQGCIFLNTNNTNGSVSIGGSPAVGYKLTLYGDMYVSGYVSLVNTLPINAAHAASKDYVDNYGAGIISTVSEESVVAVNNYRYIADGGISVNVTFVLPTTAAVGDRLQIIGKGVQGWTLTQNASQKIYLGSTTTTTGTGGYLQSSHRRDCIELVCITANLEWQAISWVGNITVV